jgi:hypothetical protein
VKKNNSFLPRWSDKITFAVAVVALGAASQAWASGWPPFGLRDSLTVTEGGVADRLDSGAASVLANDFDFERDPLIAVLQQPPKRGELLLRQDGTFVYTHDGSKSNNDSFTYRAFDGTGFSRDTLVTIDIEEAPNTPPFVTEDVPDQEAVEGVAFRLNLRGNFRDNDADDELRFSANGLPASGSLRIDPVTGVLSGTPVSSDVRDTPYDVRIRATDLAGDSADLNFDLTILRDPRSDVALKIALAANPLTVGETARWDIQIDNNGPGDLDDGQLSASWITSGPALTLTEPDNCSITGNGTSNPNMTCSITGLLASTSRMISVEGTQDADGDNSLIGIVSADDPVPGNNADLASAQVALRFSEGPTQIVDLVGNALDAGDLNGDGLIDIAAAADETIAFFNNGARALETPGTSLGSGSGGSVVAILDWNGDGSLDIAVGGLAGRTAEVFVNDLSGGFESLDRLDNGGVGTVNDMIAADLNSDGLDDLVLAGSAGTIVMKARSGGGFDTSALSTGAGLDLATADIDQDGDSDIVVVSLGDRAVDLHFNNGSGDDFSRTRLNEGSVATVNASDLNGDGAPDILLGIDGGDLSAPGNKILYQQSDGGFSPGMLFGASPVSALVTGDVNLDGWTDVVAINEAGVHQVYTGSSGSGLSLDAEQIVSGGMRRGLLSDFNGDDSLDLIMVGRDAGVLEIHANNGVGRLGLGDRVAPQMQLIGEAAVIIPAGQGYTDPGATAVDDIDGNLTDQISVSGSVNPNSVGTQTITYSVSDRAGNTASVSRQVTVGVNEGTGGSGGGVSSPWLLAGLALVLWLGRRRRIAG